MPVIHAQPYEFLFEPASLALVVIDMQRDFIEPGGFGAALGNDVRLLEPIIPAVARLLAEVIRRPRATCCMRPPQDCWRA